MDKHIHITTPMSCRNYVIMIHLKNDISHYFVNN